MEKKEIERILKEVLGLQKEIIALKPLKEIPADIPGYQGMAYPGLCAQIGEILKDKKVFYLTRENNTCFEGLIATGVCEISRDEYREAVEQFIDTCPYHKDMDTAMAFYEDGINTIQLPPVENKCLVAGPLSAVDEPDIVLMFCTPKQADILVRAQAYIGNMTKGFGGLGGCIYNIRYSFVTRKQSFSTSDFPWRTFVGLRDDEMTVTFPYERLVEIARHIPPIVEYVNMLAAMAAQA
jgi:uncharacterized protein (DUF169 family)